MTTKENSLHKIMKTHYNKYPKMTFQDMIKLLYQNNFGPGHMISNEEDSFERLVSEYQSLDINRKDDDVLFEPIGNQLCRLNLKALSDRDDLRTINKFFILSSKRTGSTQDYEKKLDELVTQVELKTFDFDVYDLKTFLTHLKSLEYPATHHSDVYNQKYHPAYRVVDDLFSLTYEVFKQIDVLRRKKEQVIIAIDGQCGSGKTSFADLLHKIYDSTLFTMDDFYLSNEQKTEDRMNEPGGNVHYERFKDEILDPLLNQNKVIYQKFNCQTQSLESPKEITLKPIIIIEGSYSMHPTLVENYDLTIFLKINGDVQKKRILARNGSEVYKRFESRWIPLENRYFEACCIEDQADLVIDTSEERIQYI